jgi:3-oxoacid CoA-transferase B subunit
MNAVERVLANRLRREDIAARIAREFHDGQVVNLGAGLPMACTDYVADDLDLVLHSEQGLLGFGRRVTDPALVDPYFLNAGRQAVSVRPGMVVVDHASSFAIVRSGRIDVSVLGALQVSVGGDLANCWLPGKVTAGIGGAQDLAMQSKRLIVAMAFLASSGEVRLVEELTFPATALGVVDLVVTDVGVFEISEDGAVMREHAPAIDPADVAELGPPSVKVSSDVIPMELTADGGAR